MLLKDYPWRKSSCCPFWQISTRSTSQGAHPSVLKIHFIIILPSSRKLSNWFLSFTLAGWNPKCISHFFVYLSLVRTTCSTHLIVLDFIVPLTYDKEVKTINFSLRISLNFMLLSSPLYVKVLLVILSSYT